MRKMLQNWLQCLFIFIIYTIFRVNCGLLQENRTAEEESLSDIEPRVICESMFCSCADFVELGNVTCLGSDGNDIRELAFYETNGDFHLCKKMFLGLNIHSLTLNVTKITVDEKFLEGIVALSVFNVEQSDIEVMYIFFLNFVFFFSFTEAKLIRLYNAHFYSLF